MFQISPLVKNILIINVLMFLASLALQTKGFGELMSGFYPLSNNFKPWQPITSMFMHSGLTHIFFNMFALVMFGPRLEMNWGPKRFLTYYMFTGLGAFLVHFLVVYMQSAPLIDMLDPAVVAQVKAEGRDIILKHQYYTDPDWFKLNRLINVPVVGASGAIYGILLAYGMKYPNDRVMLLFPPIPMKVKYLVIGLGVFTLFSGMQNSDGDNVAHFAHLGGMIFGFIMIKYWDKKLNSGTNYFN